MPVELYYLSRGKLTQKQGLYSKISKMQLKGDLRSKNRAAYYTDIHRDCKKGINIVILLPDGPHIFIKQVLRLNSILTIGMYIMILMAIHVNQH